MINFSSAFKHKPNYRLFLKAHYRIPAIFSILIIIFISLYSSRLLFPSELYNSKIKILHSTGLVTGDVTTRAPTGWLSDKATECLSLGVGSQNIDRFGDIFLDNYTNPMNTYNPCEGILINSGESAVIGVTDSYARYWHGHAVITQWLIMLIGLPSLRNLIWALNIFLIIYIGIGKTGGDKKNKFKGIGLSFVLPYFLFADIADLHTSITHVYASIFALLTLLIFLKYFYRSRVHQLQTGFLLGSIYCFVLYGLSPQSIPVILLSWGTVSLLLNNFSAKKVLQNFSIFIYGWTIGYLLTFITKWILVGVFTNFNIWDNVFKQFLYRTSQSGTNLSEGVGRHLEFAHNFPSFIQSWIANISTLLIHIIDPRYSSLLLVLIFIIFVFILTILIFKNLAKCYTANPRNYQNIMLINLASLLFLLGWYAILAQHSFDHATYTYRSLVIWLGGLIGSLLQIETKQKLISKTTLI
jgi:hypothetical protein